MSKNQITHPELVKTLKKPGADILRSLTAEKADLLHVAFALPGEVGELCDAIKKHIFYEQELDMENVMEELGDTEFYLEGLRQNLGIKRESTTAHNIRKLEKRYAGLKYSNRAAKDRADKNT